jgi:hypothetical protein
MATFLPGDPPAGPLKNRNNFFRLHNR